MIVPVVSRLFIYTAVVAVIAGAAMAHRPVDATHPAVIATARPAGALS